MAEPSLNFVNSGLRNTSKLIVLSLVAVALLLLDNRYSVVNATRSHIATAMYPLQWLAQQPINAFTKSIIFLKANSI